MQINKFFSSYYSEWRYIQILSISKQMETKYDFYADIITEVKRTDPNAGENTIAQEISNGLMFETVQTVMQYIEDLFALINTSKNQDFFIRDIIQYKAGKIQAQIKKYSLERKNVCASFHFPYYTIDDSFIDKDKTTLDVINQSIDRLMDIIKEIVEFYKKNLFFYNQYKHGLSIALNPYGDYSEERIEKDKNGKIKRKIIAMDSLNFKGASKNQYGNEGYLLMPAISQDFKQINQLQNENNLLRFVNSPPDINFEMIQDIAFKTKRCLQIFIHNFLNIINEIRPYNLQLPAEDKHQVYSFTIESE